MHTRDTVLSKRFIRLVTCVLFLLAASLLPKSSLAIDKTASKDCSTSPCTVVVAKFTLFVNFTISWQATYTGSPTQGHSFFLTQNSCACLNDIPLTTSGQTSGTKSLAAGTYFISIKLALMGPGFYTVSFPASVGDPHITTINGTHYDFQSAGEFVLLRHPNGSEIQTRQEPIATTFNPGPDPHDGLATCVSLNNAVAARVGKHRVTYEPNLNGVPDPSGLQLRVDGVLTTLGQAGLDLGNRARITKTTAPGGIQIDFPDRSVLLVTPGFWVSQQKWYLSVDPLPRPDSVGIAGAIPSGSWLPALPDGTSMGPMPRSLHDRYVALYQTFADSWRVTDTTTLFDYAPGTSTNTFTMRNWPLENPPCVIPAITPVAPVSETVANQACRLVTSVNARNNCVFDVMVTGNTGFATTYEQTQDLEPNLSTTIPSPNKLAVFLDLGAGIPHGTFSNFFNPGFSFNAGLEYMINPHFSAEGIFGYHHFPGKVSSSVNLYQISANSKAYFTAPPNNVRPFVNGGVGAYKFSPGSTRFGGNLGVGVLYEVTPRFGLQGSYNFHMVNTPGTATRFSTLQGGVRFVF
jgi:hypothetical protein